jgi:hypothetical protein
MFDNSFPLNFIFRKPFRKDGYLVAKSTYAFSTPSESYLLEVEEYKYDIYIIKFFPKRLKNNPKRFNVLTGENKLGGIIGTCIYLILQILKKSPMANFGFLGSHTIDFKREYEEKKECTKRFKIYRYAVFNLIGEEAFSHFMEEKNSTYLLVNNKHEDVDRIKDKADQMFDVVFPRLNGI